MPFRDLKGVFGVRRSRCSGADKICVFLKFCQRIYIKWYFEVWELPKMQKIIKIRQKVCKLALLQTFFQNLRKKVCRGAPFDEIRHEFKAF